MGDLKKTLMLIALLSATLSLGCSPQKSTPIKKNPPETVAKKTETNKKPKSPLPTETSKANCVDATTAVCDAEIELTRLTNDYRSQNNLQALVLDEKLSFAARDWSRQQGEQGSISHAGFGNGQRMSVLRKRFPNVRLPSLSRENVAMTSLRRGQGAGFVREFAQMWIGSRGHRINILSSTRRIGVGIYIDSRGAAYATQIFGN